MSQIKLPHWAFMALGLVAIVITWIMNQQADGQLVLPATVLTVLTVLRTVIGMLAPSVSAKVNVAAARRAPTVPPMAVLLLVGLAFLLVPFTGVILTACANGGAVAPIVQPVADLTAKIIADALKGMTVAQIVEDTGADILTVFEALLGSHDASVLKSPAFQEAMTTKLGMARMDAGAP